MKRIVVKVGTSTLTHENGELNLRKMDELVRVLSDIRGAGTEVILVTSGAKCGQNKSLKWWGKEKAPSIL